MSANNVILILQTPSLNSKNPYEFRVVHCQAMDNLTYNDPDGDPDTVVDYFGDCKVFTDEGLANKEAGRLYDEIMYSDCPIIEYDIQKLRLPNTFQYYLDHCKNKNRWETEKEELYREALEKIDEICRTRESDGVGYDIRIHNIVKNALNI